MSSFQRANHVLETENAKIKMQLFSEEELIQLCCPEDNIMPDLRYKTATQPQLEQEIEKIKQELHQL